MAIIASQKRINFGPAAQHPNPSMHKKGLSLFVILLACFSLYAQQPKQMHDAARVIQAPKIDGELGDSCWNVAAVSGFIQQSPEPGKLSRQRSEVRMVYDDQAVYVAAWLYDTSPDSILHQLGARDESDINTDHFSVLFDTYYDQRNAFYFSVSAAGVQTDGRYDFDKLDVSWNAVWFSRVKIHDWGWAVEMKIPYAALRFPKKEEQSWGVNFQRYIRRYRESSNWNTVNPTLQGVVNQSGIVSGMRRIEAPLRLSFMPYVSGYLENYQAANAYSFNGGMDVKYGINESFTLDLTLVPDFGQTQSDNLVLNLSPFEVKYDERRYFFTEGTELFNKNDLFYSRRIGAVPAGYNTVEAQLDSHEVIVKNPSVTRLYNAAKLSGRTKKKLGVGLFNAVTAPAYAEISDSLSGESRQLLTEPLANYNVLVIDRGLKNNSFVSFVNTNVIRNGSRRDANVSGVQFKLANPRNTYAVEGYADGSLLWKDGAADPVPGFRYYLRAARTKGNYTCDVKHRLVSDTFDPNDIGYQDRNNSMSITFDQNYDIYKPFWKINRWHNDVGIDYFLLYHPRHYTFFNIDGRHIVTFRSFHTIGLNWLAQPVVNYDYFETRVPGRFYLYPRNFEGGGFISSDYRRVFALDLSGSYRWFAERSRTIVKYVVSPRWRVNDRLMMIFRNENEIKKDNVGFAALVSDSVIFGLRNINTVTNTLTVKYIFSSTMSLSFRARHYWSAADYRMYFVVEENGELSVYNYSGNKDINYNAFNIDMVYTWQFLPGSELSAVWKNSIYTSDPTVQPGYFEDVQYTFAAPQSNGFSVKLIWYLDYQGLRKGRLVSY